MILENPSQAARIRRAAIIVALLALVFYLPVLRNGFVNLDDDLYVSANVRVRSLDGSMLRWAFTDMSVAFWHPVTWLSHAADVALWGLDPRGHHLTSIVLHAANTFLVVLLVFRVLGRVGGAGDGGAGRLPDGFRTIAAVATGALFGLHPLHVESVAWVSERKDVLCAFFYLLGLAAYLGPRNGERDGAGDGRGRAGGSVVLAFVFFVLAAISKPMAVSFPAVLLLLDWYPLGRITSWRTAARAAGQKAPFLAVSLVISFLAVMARTGMGGAITWAEVLSLKRLLVVVRSVFFYLEKMALPVGLSPYYPYPPETSLFAPEYAVPAVLSIAAVVILVLAKKRWLAALAAYYLLTLLPTLGQLQYGGQAVADRYSYLPSVGPFLLAGLGAAAAWRSAGSPALRKAIGGAAIMLVLALGAATARQAAVWKDSITLWDRAIERAPELAIAYNNRGAARKDRQEWDLAVEDLTKAITLDPGLYRAYANRGVALAALDAPERALADLSVSIALNPSFADAYTSRGLVWIRMGQVDRAIADLTTAAALAPNSVEAALNLGVAHERAGRYDLALRDDDLALALDPDDALALSNRGIALGRLGRYNDAIRDQEKALSLDPRLAQAYRGLAEVYREMGQSERARDAYGRACDLGDDVACAALPKQGHRRHAGSGEELR